jgi:predicted secreted Zn-dependent protease
MTAAQIIFDRLAYIDKLTKVGVADDTARAHADALDQAIRDSVATKTDIASVKADIAIVAAEVQMHRWLLGLIVLLQLASLGALVSLIVKLVR